MSTRRQHTDETLALFFTQLALIYDSGMDLRDGLDVLEHSQHVAMPDLIARLKRTGKLSLALDDDPQFPQEAKLALHAAEVVGQEGQVAQHLANYYQRQDETKRFLRDILMLPVILITVLVLVMGVLSFVVVPVFEAVYQSLGGSVEPWVQTLVTLAKFSVIIALVLFGFIVLIVLKEALSAHWDTSHPSLIDRLLRYFPKLKAKTDLARFTFIAQLVLSAGLHPQEAMDLALAQVPAGSLKNTLVGSRKSLKPTSGLMDLLMASGVYPPLLQNTLAIAVKTGKTDQVMETVARKTQEDAEGRLMALLNRIEPILIVVLSAFVGIVLFSLIIPLIGIMSALG
jgi:type IV pilus assembly protein PilC